VLDRDAVARRYTRVRARTAALAARLSDEDAMVQSMPDASPTKWHLAHTTWFFEEFFLSRFELGHRWPDERWRVLFNSYYDAVGAKHPRAARGVLSRPSLEQVRAWRASVDERVLAAVARPRAGEEGLGALLLGTHHEEQHQELILTDIQHALWCSELRPAYRDDGYEPSCDAPPLTWIAHDEAEVWVGCEESQGREGDASALAFDNETPRHRVIVGAHRLASRLVTNGEFAAFVDDGGYTRPELWLSDGWAAARTNGWCAPLYWEGEGAERRVFGIRGMQSLDPHAPVIHVSFYEADAYARWAAARLPTEFEWERASQQMPVEGNFLDEDRLAPRAAPGRRAGAEQLFGDAWEWTASAYLPYPRFQPLAGALGEYNGKFMSGQMVLRGGSCFSPREHLRATYRNFFPPSARWQISGIRLARDD
jgi:ergothioneine biosynthesis protein EgtB